MARQVWAETGSLLVKKFGFDPVKHQKYIETTESRFRNPHLSDAVTRVARGPKRKLGGQGPAGKSGCTAPGSGSSHFAGYVIGAAFHFRLP